MKRTIKIIAQRKATWHYSDFFCAHKPGTWYTILRIHRGINILHLYNKILNTDNLSGMDFKECSFFSNAIHCY